MTSWLRWGPVAGLLLFVLPIGLGAWRIAGPAAAAVGPGGERPPVSEVGGGGGNVDSLARMVRHRGPFRPDGRPSARPYDPSRSEDGAAAYAAPKPTLVLSGVIDGSTPMAVIEGIPGQEGALVLGVGDTVAGLRIRQIREGRVTINGMDTTWVLTLRRGP